MLKSILTNSTFTTISRVLGFLRDVLIAHFLGAGIVSDCFFVAFKLPNFFRRLFAEGAFNAAFVPMFSKTLESGANAEIAKLNAKDFAEQVLAVLLLSLILVFGMFEIFMPYAMYVLAPGFSDEPERYTLAVDLTRTTFCYLLFISLVSLYSGILNTMMKFAVTAAAPILLNVALITALVGFSTVAKTPGHALAWGVAAAGALQLVWVAGAAGREGMALRLRMPKFSKEVMDFLKLIAPAALGAGAMQLNLMMDNILASFLPKGSISFLYYADRINEFPVGVIGVAVGTVLLPFLSRQLAAGNHKDALNSLNRAMELVLLLTLPAAAACLVVPTPLITALFQSGEFSAADTGPTVYTLMAFSLGLPAYVLVKILTPGFFARHDTKTPVRFAMICIGINFCLNVILMLSLMPYGVGHVGLALSTAISAWVNVGLLSVTLHKRGHFSADAQLKRRTFGVLGSCVVMAVGLAGLAYVLTPYFAGSALQRVGSLAALVGVGILLYFAAGRVFGAYRIADLKRLAGRGPTTRSAKAG
jgi:putative peptidoglycan lipid II flippase